MNAVHTPPKPETYQYDVALSFAGSDRAFVEAVATGLRNRGVRVFYDDFERATLWGKDLYEHLDWLYREAARYCVLFVSRAYADRVWTTHERRSAQARALEQHGEYVLPARFDDTEVPGLRRTVGHINLTTVSPEELSDLIVEKLGPRQTERFFPPEPNRLFEALEVDDEDEQEDVALHAYSFFESLLRMTEEEREVVFRVLLGGCHAEMPQNIHMSLELLRRETGMPVSKLTALLAGLRPLGFTTKLRDSHPGEDHELIPDDKVLVLEWSSLKDSLHPEDSLRIADAMIWQMGEDYCPDCATRALQRLDFSPLADATADEHAH